MGVSRRLLCGTKNLRKAGAFRANVHRVEGQVEERIKNYGIVTAICPPRNLIVRRNQELCDRWEAVADQVNSTERLETPHAQLGLPIETICLAIPIAKGVWKPPIEPMLSPLNIIT